MANRYRPVPLGQFLLDDVPKRLTTPWRLWLDWLVRPNTRTPLGITVGASPFTMIADSDGFYLFFGGTVSGIGISRNGSVFYNTGQTSGQIVVQRSDQIQVVYTVAPTITWFGEILEGG